MSWNAGAVASTRWGANRQIRIALNFNILCVQEVPKDGWIVMQFQAQTSSWAIGDNNALFQ
eukprot:875088-Lingulodinium_polyedra.AAC.1